MTRPTSDTEVPAFWQALGLPGLADLQVQFLPPRMLRRAWTGASESNAPTVRPSDTTATLVGTSRPIIYKWSDEERVEHLQTMGVRAFTALAYADQANVAADLNAWTLDFATRKPGCLPGATFFPEAGVNRYTRAAIDAGARIFKVRFEPGQISPSHALLDAVWGVLTEAGIPVIVDQGIPAPSTVHNGPNPLETVLRRHPRLTAVIAYLGAPDYVEYIELAERYERVCLDTSLSFTGHLEDRSPFPRAHLPRVRALGLAGKVLHGSDFPNLSHSYASQLSALAELDLGDDWLRAVCWENAANLLQLS